MRRLEVFSLASGSPVHAGSVEVGLEPIAVAARTNGEVWVVNHLSDSVSVVDVAASPPRVVRTLLVGDEPRDVVFAGPGRNRAFVTAAHRGQNNPNDPQLTTEGVGRADVWVFDALALGAPLGGTPLTIVTLFGDTPRALATDASGETVFAAVFHSGNQTTTVTEQAVCDGFDTAGPCNVHGVTMPGGLPGPDTNHAGVPAPETGLVVKYDETSAEWRDQLGRDWSNAVKFDLPDLDVLAIDAMANPPVELEAWPSVGTVVFNMAVNPASGKVYASNTEARNEVRFEGPGVFGGSTVRGRLAEARITVIDPAQPDPALGVTPRHLNKHIDYGVVPSPPGTADKSLATPLEMAVTSDGATLYVAAFGSSKIGVFATSALENDTFVPSAASHIEVSGGGPSGVVLDEARGRLYVLTRFDNALSVIDTTSATEIAHTPLYNPEPAAVQVGRPVLYDARATSSNGEASCAACHIFGDFDSLAWDLGNPDDDVLDNLNPFRVPDPLGQSFPDHHPMKGPMTTQSLRGMANHGPMHWRGDRSGANDTPPSGALNEKAAFIRFNVAFEGLLGRSGPIPAGARGDAHGDGAHAARPGRLAVLARGRAAGHDGAPPAARHAGAALRRCARQGDGQSAVDGEDRHDREVHGDAEHAATRALPAAAGGRVGVARVPRRDAVADRFLASSARVAAQRALALGERARGVVAPGRVDHDPERHRAACALGRASALARLRPAARAETVDADGAVRGRGRA
ncbi:MAG: hypothetical protein AB1689_21145, partial [Thermodesulfobacteriota bacterium]